MREWTAIRCGAIAVAVMLVSAASCSTIQPLVESSLSRLQFLGDSITVQSTTDINAHYAGRYNVGIDATVGEDTYLLADDVPIQAAQAPDIEIINLGTNDATRIDKPPSYEVGLTLAAVTGRLDTFASAFPASTCVIFVTVDAHNPSWSPGNARLINDHIRATAGHVADWDAAWQPAYFDQPDSPHPNEVGRQALLALEDQAIAACASDPPPTTTSTSTTSIATEPTVPETTPTLPETTVPETTVPDATVPQT